MLHQSKRKWYKPFPVSNHFLTNNSLNIFIFIIKLFIKNISSMMIKHLESKKIPYIQQKAIKS